MQESKSNLFGELLDWLISEPRNFIMVIITVFMLFVSVPALVISILAGFLCKRLGIPSYWLLILGAVLFGCLWRVTAVTFLDLRALNLGLLQKIIAGERTVLLNPLWWGLSLPYGLLLSAFMLSIMKKSSRLTAEIKRISNGERGVKHYLSVKQCSEALSNIQSAAIEGGTCLGVDRLTGENVYLLDVDANLHTLAIGTTGSGKTTGIANIIESAILRKHPVIIVDGKGDLNLSQKVKVFAEQHGVIFYGFSMIGESVKYNPLASGGITSKKDRIIALRQWTEEHYKKIAEGYLQTVFKILDACNIQTDLHQLAQYLEPVELAQLAQPLKNESLMSAVRGLKTKRPDIESLKAEIENLSFSEIGHLFDSNSGRVLTLEKALAENAVVYFCLQPLAFPSYAECLGKLIINDIKQLAANQLSKVEKQKIYTIFDEFSVFAGDQVINLINQGRSAGIHAVLSTQSLSDISKTGGDTLVGQVLNNCNNYIIQRQNNPEDAETLANIIGTFDDFEVTSQISITEVSGRTGSVKSVKQYLVHPDEIKRLGLGEAVFMNKRQFLVRSVQLRVSAIQEQRIMQNGAI